MEFFKDAKAVRLRSHHDKYLIAEDDNVSVSQDQNGSADCATWIIEQISNNNNIRLKSCYGNYLTATSERFLLGATGRKVIQSLPWKLDSSVEWKPIRDGEGLKLQSESGRFLRANAGPPPWKNSVTHDLPLRSSSQDYIVWFVDVLQSSTSAEPPGQTNGPGNTPGQQMKNSEQVSNEEDTGNCVGVNEQVDVVNEEKTKNGKQVQNEEDADNYAGVNEQVDVVNEEKTKNGEQVPNEEEPDNCVGVNEQVDVVNEEKAVGGAKVNKEGEVVVYGKEDDEGLPIDSNQDVEINEGGDVENEEEAVKDARVNEEGGATAHEKEPDEDARSVLDIFNLFCCNCLGHHSR